MVNLSFTTGSSIIGPERVSRPICLGITAAGPAWWANGRLQRLPSRPGLPQSPDRSGEPRAVGFEGVQVRDRGGDIARGPVRRDVVHEDPGLAQLVIRLVSATP